MNSMKMVKWQLLILLLLISVNSCRENENQEENKEEKIQHVFGIYSLEETCVDRVSGSVSNSKRKVVIKENTKLGVLINIDIDFNLEFKASISNDSLFIPLQYWEIYNGSQASFRGEGEIKNDSLFLHYTSGSTLGFFICDCKGKKTELDIK
jgi:hypothetical protein